MIHGGAFLAGTRNDMAYYSMEMARRGFVTATISYRLGWNCPASDLLQVCAFCQGEAAKFRVAMYRGAQDTKSALRHLTANANELGIDTSFVFLQGESAGAINALHAAYLEQDEVDAWCPTCVAEVGLLDTAGNNHTITPNIKGVVSSCGGLGLTDFLDAQQQIPVISFHDDNDIVVPYGYGQFVNCLIGGFGSFSVKTRLESNGVCTQLNTVVHPPLDLPAHCSYPANAIIGKASCFLKNILCETCTSSANTQIWNIPDCSAGGFVSIEDVNRKDWVTLNGNRLIFEPTVNVSSVQVYDVSMRLLMDLPVNSSNEMEFPTSLHGCMFVKIDMKNGPSKVKRWCNF